MCHEKSAKYDLDPLQMLNMFALIFNVPVYLPNVVRSVETGYTGELYYVNQKQSTDNDCLKSFPYLVPQQSKRELELISSQEKTFKNAKLCSY